MPCTRRLDLALLGSQVKNTAKQVYYIKIALATIGPHSACASSISESNLRLPCESAGRLRAQAQLAKAVGLSRSRVAKVEAAVPSVEARRGPRCGSIAPFSLELFEASRAAVTKPARDTERSGLVEQQSLFKRMLPG